MRIGAVLHPAMLLALADGASFLERGYCLDGKLPTLLLRAPNSRRIASTFLVIE